jgi:hypothetical protein
MKTPLALTSLLAFVALSFGGCGVPDTSTEILADLTKEFKTPIRYLGADIEADPCTYELLKKLWLDYYGGIMRPKQAAEFRAKLLMQTDLIELQPSAQVVKFTGHANMLYCEVGVWCIRDEGPGDYDFCIERTCGSKAVDDEIVQVGDNRPLHVNITKGKTLVIGDEYMTIEGAFMRYNVRNLEPEYNGFTTINEPVFQRWLHTLGGEMFNPLQAYIRPGGSMAGRHCANPLSVRLTDLVN